jgi:hypothetical protein
MKIIFFKGLIAAVIIISFIVIVPVSQANHEDDFKQASNLDYYAGLTNLQSAQLDINLISVVHQENLQIIQTLQEIEDRLSKLETSIETIEKQVVRK